MDFYGLRNLGSRNLPSPDDLLVEHLDAAVARACALVVGCEGVGAVFAQRGCAATGYDRCWCWCGAVEVAARGSAATVDAEPGPGRSIEGQVRRTLVIACRSAEVTHTPYLPFTATCLAT